MNTTATIATLIITLVLALIVAGVMALSWFYVVGTYRRAARILSEWAERNGYRIIESDRRYLRKGPFFWTSSQSQIIYHVTVQDAYGNTRRGWVRCGSYFFGPWKDIADVVWDE